MWGAGSFQRFKRRARWRLGRGWSGADFAERYASGAADAWGYRGSPEHARRAEAILAALPARRFACVLEVGCAQGFLTERLAARADRLVACDISPEAVARAREACGDRAGLEFRVADIRQEFPGAGFDLMLFSDVLYYLAPREIDAVLAEAGRRAAPQGHLLLANEWRDGASGLTPPSYALARLDGDAVWTRESRGDAAMGAATLTLALYRRRICETQG